MVGQGKAEGVEVAAVHLLIAESGDALLQEGSDAVDAQGDVANALRTMPYGIEDSHGGEQCL